MRILLPAFAVALLASCAPAPMMADPASDAPELRETRITGVNFPASYPEALRRWQGAEDVNAWIGARFEYDFARAIRLSESQRAQAGRVPIYPPEQFFAIPTGICVDLARFGVETLRAVAPASKPSYLMIEFDPVSIAGNVLRRHWLVMFERNGNYYFFADSKRPGFLAGPYATVQQFIDQYSQYRGRRIVAYRSLDSYERKLRKQAPRAIREKRA